MIDLTVITSLFDCDRSTISTMANTTAFFLSDTTEVDEYFWWEWWGCTSDGRKAFTIIWCLFVIFLMMLVLHMIYTLIQNKPKSMAITLFYLIFSLMYYIDSIMMSLNQCYGRDGGAQYFGWYIRLILYVLGFLILLLMWFYRLYTIFSVTAYPLTKTTIIIFIVYVVIGLIMVILMLITLIAAQSNLALEGLFNVLTVFGTFWIVIGMIAVPGVYIKKLYKILLNAAASIKHTFDDTKSAQKNASELNLVLCISKNSVLTVFTLVGTLLTLVINVIIGITISASLHDQYWTRKVQETILLIDHTSNILGYVLGFSYANAVYALLCGCVDKRVRVHIGNRFNRAGSVTDEHLHTETGRTAQNIQPVESTMTTSTTTVNIEQPQERPMAFKRVQTTSETT
eukprot:1145717_1